MIEELQTFIISANETVANVMIQSLSGILLKPDLYKSVYEEIVQVWPETNESVPQLKS